MYWDECGFFIGVINLIVSSWLVGAYPHAFWGYYCISIIGFLAVQLVKSIPKRQQFWMLELCYVVNYLFLLFFILVLTNACPWPSTVFRVFFSFCVGPLAMSIPVFRNSLVFHESDKLVILSLHWSPNVAIWGIRWFPKQLEESFPGLFTAALGCGNDPRPQLNQFFTDALCPGSFSDLFLWAALMYFIFWAIPYYLFFFCCAQESLRRGGYITMFEDMRVRPGVDTVLLLGGDWGQEIKYSLFHASLSCSSLLLGPCLWHSFHLHTIYLGVIFSSAIYNGATFYFRVFAKKYYREIQSARNNAAAIFPTSTPSEDFVAENDLTLKGPDELEAHKVDNGT